MLLHSERRLPESMRVVTSLNYSLMGNPGTGKSTVARLLGKLLFELGLRKKNVVVETTGEKMLQMKPADVPDFIDTAMDGVLFIDEAYNLEPGSNQAGKAIVNLLMTAAEDQHTNGLFCVDGILRNSASNKLLAHRIACALGACSKISHILEAGQHPFG